ncbi:MAG: hypothetical protein M5U26_07760 [Planctomycetota bacterium]|nr:hypothetical protein [Planctomycetota bacterium]
MLIAVSGVDYAGKSTQIERLAAHFRGAGRRCKVAWFRPGYSATLDALRRLVRRLRSGALPSAQQPEARARTFGKPWVRRWWTRMALFDMVLQYGVKLRLLSWLGWVVICDRYVYDGLLDLELRFPDLGAPRWLSARLARALCPRPRHHLLLTLTWETIQERLALKNEPFPDPPEVRRARYERYVNAPREAFTFIDAAGSPEAVEARIRAALGLAGAAASAVEPA